MTKLYNAILAFTLSVASTEECGAQSYTSATVAGGVDSYAYVGTGDGGLATNAGLGTPVTDLVLDKAGNLYIATRSSVRKVTPSGLITTVAGGGTSLGEAVPAIQAAVSPLALAVDAAGTLFIADAAFGIYRVRQIATDGKMYTIAGGGPCCDLGDGGPATSAYIGLPYGIAISGTTLYIAQSDPFGTNVVRRVTSDGSITTVIGSDLASPRGVAVDSAGNLFVAEAGANRIRRVSKDGALSTVASVEMPWHVALDANGILFVTQPDSSRVSRIGTDVTQIAGAGSSAAGLDRPTGIALDSKGQIFVADGSFSIGRVVRLTETTLPPPTITAGGIVPVSGKTNTIQPGSWVSIFGTNLAASSTVWKGDFPTSLGGTTVIVNGKPAYLWYVSPTQINFQAPNDLSDGAVTVVVRTAAGSASQTVTLARYAPSLILLSTRYPVATVTVNGPGSSGSGYDVIAPLGAFSFTTRPVSPGETLVLYGVGFGPTNPDVPAGQVFAGAARSITTPQVTIGGVPATVTFAGLIQAGLYQLNVVVPNVASGDQSFETTVGAAKAQAGLLCAEHVSTARG